MSDWLLPLIVVASICIVVLWELAASHHARQAQKQRRDARFAMRVARTMFAGERRRPKVDPRIQRRRAVR